MISEKGFLDEGDLLDKNGELIESGYALSQVKRYSRAEIKRNKLRIKEWDYYCFCDETSAIALTVADNSYMSLGSVSVIDFKHLKYVTSSVMGFMPRGKLNMPSSCRDGNVSFGKGKADIEFVLNPDGSRTLGCEYAKFDGKKNFSCELRVEPVRGDNITVAIPFDKPRRFYYNTKINCLKADGWYKVGSERHEIQGAYGVLDWGRGMWQYKNTWYWSSLSCEIDGKSFGLNLGYGFGNPTATENVIFRDGRANKLDNVKFEIPYTQGKLDYLKPWHITDDNRRLELMFYPLIDRKDRTNAGIISTDQHQVFGRFYGKAVLDDGSIISIEDKTGFAEHVVNKW